MDGTILDVTDEVEAVLGYTPEMLLGTNMSALLQPNDLPAFADQLSKLVSGDHVRCMGRIRLFAREGELVWVENRLCVVPPATSDGRPSLMCTVVLLSFLQELGNAASVECISKVCLRARTPEPPLPTLASLSARVLTGDDGGSVRHVHQLPTDVALVNDIVATVYQQHDVDRTEARLRDATTAAAMVWRMRMRANAAAV